MMEVECDAINVANVIRKRKYREDSNTYMNFDMFSWNNVRRVGNVVAHLAARLVLSNGCLLRLFPKISQPGRRLIFSY